MKVIKGINKLFLWLYNKYIVKSLKLKNKLYCTGIVTINSKNITIGKGCVIYKGCHLWGEGFIKIGDNVSIGKDTILYSNKEIIIGDNTLIAAQCYIIDSDHGINKNMIIREQEMVSEPIYIEDDVWIGAGVKILKGLRIGKGAVIGAGAVVNKDVENYSIVAGVPGEKIGQRM